MILAVQRAKDVVLAYPALSARDALHVAVLEAHRVTRILTFDPGFGESVGIERVKL